MMHLNDTLTLSLAHLGVFAIPQFLVATLICLLNEIIRYEHR